MGGVEGGEVASTVAVQTIVEYVCGVAPWADASMSDTREGRGTLPGVKTGLHEAFERGDAQVKQAAQRRGGGDMGTTLTAAYLLWPSLYVAHVGDSRCYLLRDGALVQLTTDHTMANKLKQASDIDLDESSPWHHVLWNAIGGGQHASMEPELHRHPLSIGDVILLCSDGLNKHATDEEIADAINASPSADEACKRLVAMANAGGGSDNITVVVARCKFADQLMVDSEAPTMVRKV
jgi:protein phosphatase